MKMSNCKNLGLIVTEVMATYKYESQDYDMDGSGECGSIISRGWDQYREMIVRGHGFANLYHFMAVVEKRTSYRYVYFMMGIGA